MMKLKYKVYFIISFVILPFLFMGVVNADYEATVVNQLEASCSHYEGSTGNCYYTDGNLNDIVKGVFYLDTGDKLTVIEDDNYPNIPSPDTNICSDFYVYTKFYFAAKGKSYTGYYCNSNLLSTALNEELTNQFKDAGFPESYWEDLAILKTVHPNWNFIAIDTNLDFKDAVLGESVADRSLVEISASNNYAYLSIDGASFNYYDDYYIEYDRKNSGNPFCRANYDTIAYYLDPRNFLNDMYIFQFEGLAYDSNISDETFLNSINNIFKDDYLANFSETFLTAAKESNVSPVYLAALSKQEVSNWDTAGTAIDGLYNGMYNFYNIGAGSDENPVYNGLNFAALEDDLTLRPWNDEYRAIVGGALWMADKYIKAGQNTSYFKRWNTIEYYLKESGKVTEPYYNFQHQYMTNVMAPSSEAKTTYRSYSNTKMLNLDFIFYIPVYENMPEETKLPSKGGWPNNYLESLSINGKDVVDFDGGVEVYDYNLNINTKEITFDAKSVSDSANITGLGTFEISEDTTKEIIVTAQNGDVKTYKINITLTEMVDEEPIDVVTTLNNSGIKNGDKYLSGFSVGTDISYIKEKISVSNPDAQVLLQNSNGEEKNSGKLVTGDKVKIIVGEETKEYEIVVYGDANGDGEINAIDYVRIRKYIMNTATLSNSQMEASDANKDGAVNAIDYVRIRKYIMGTASIEQ